MFGNPKNPRVQKCRPKYAVEHFWQHRWHSGSTTVTQKVKSSDFCFRMFLKKGLNCWYAPLALFRIAVNYFVHFSFRSKITLSYLAEVLQGIWWLLTISSEGCLFLLEKKTASDDTTLRRWEWIYSLQKSYRFWCVDKGGVVGVLGSHDLFVRR